MHRLNVLAGLGVVALGLSVMSTSAMSQFRPSTGKPPPVVKDQTGGKGGVKVTSGRNRSHSAACIVNPLSETRKAACLSTRARPYVTERIPSGSRTGVRDHR